MVGQTILHYRLLEKLGAGGMGEIYKAEDTRLKRVVALKWLSPRLSAEPERRKRFFQEARAASALNHPNIITVYDIISENDTQCIVMEYVAGKTLREVIPTGGLTAGQALGYSIQMADALAAAHAAGIIHRDLKPSNVMITNSGLLKILDFGLAKWLNPSLSGSSEDQATVDQLTTEGSIIGTVSYMSPEQAVGKPVDTRSDIFSFGCVMYEMVTGRRAFEGSSGISTLSSILRDDVQPISRLAPGVPHALEQLIVGCLPKDPNARWQSMTEIKGRLMAVERQQYSGGRVAAPAPPTEVSPGGPREPAAAPAPTVVKSVPVAAKRISGKPARRTALAWAALGVVLVAIAAVGGWSVWKSYRQPPPQPVARVVVPAPSAPAPVAPTPEPPPVASAPASPAPETTLPAPKSSPAKKASSKSNPPPVKAAPTAKPPSAPSAPVAPSQPAPAVQPPPAPVPAPRAPAISLTPVTVSDALPFRMFLAEDVPADAEQGTAIRFTVADGVRVGDDLVIAKGASVLGQVAHGASKGKFLGLGGSKATFELQQVTAVDGKKLSVRATAGRPADERATRPFDTGKGSKPKGIAAVQGTEYIGYIDGDQTVSVSK